MLYLQVNDLEMFYEQIGAGEPVVFRTAPIRAVSWLFPARSWIFNSTLPATSLISEATAA